MYIKKIILVLFILRLTSCTAIESITNSIGRNTTALFRSSKKIESKISDPYRPEARLAVLWIGHATVLIQIEDKFILTDPNLLPTVGQFSKRLIEPGIDPKNLPQLDAVLISHMHIDHLSLGSLDEIEGKINILFVPQKGLVYIPNFNFETDELKTWQTWEEDGLKITSVPVVHNGWRYALDDAWMDKSFTGYLIEYKGIKVYFGGDTAYDSLIFKETGKRFPGIDLALLPIAPIHPREYSKLRHTDPNEAIQIFLDLKAKWMMPIHFDTYTESYDTLGEAPAVLKSEMLKQHLSDDQISILKIGEQKVFIRKKNNQYSPFSFK